MSVLVTDRTESRLIAITYSEEIHDMLLDLMRRKFGVKDLEHLVRMRYAYGLNDKEDFEFYHAQMVKYKGDIDKAASRLTTNLRAAYNRYPTNLHEFEIRRDFLNSAISDCGEIEMLLQRVAERFDVDLNQYGQYIKALYQEIGYIKKWRQRDNKIKSSLKG